MAVQIAIVNIREEEFHLKNDLPEITGEKDLRFGLDFVFNINEEKQLFEVKTFVTLNKEQSQEKLLDFKTSLTYLINGLPEVYTKFENGTFDLKNNMMEFLLHTNISTVRGMLVTRLQDTKLNQLYIPIFDIKQMMGQMKKREGIQGLK